MYVQTITIYALREAEAEWNETQIDKVFPPGR
jgi:hypothetical protein